MTTARTYTDGTIFHTSDADTHFPHENSKTRKKDTEFLLDHGIKETCPSMKVYHNNEELRTNVNPQSTDNVALLMSCQEISNL